MGRKIHLAIRATGTSTEELNDWLTTPVVEFDEGVAESYDLTQHLRSAGVGRTITLASGALPSGVSIDNTDGAQALVYSGIGGVGTTSGIVLDSSVTVTNWLTLEGSGANLPATFGTVFALGEMPAVGAALRVGTAQWPVQMDVKTRWIDGSVKHAIFSLVAPVVADQAAALVQSSAISGTAVSISDLGTYTATLTVTLGGTPWSLSFAQARGLSGTSKYRTETWLSGPVVSEWIAGGPLRDASSNEHATLHAWFHVRRYSTGHTRTDVVLENGWSNSSPGTIDCVLSYNVDGVTAAEAGYTHQAFARVFRRFWTLARTTAQPDLYVRQSTRRLSRLGVTPKFRDVGTYTDEELTSANYIPQTFGGPMYTRPVTDGTDGWSWQGSAMEIGPVSRIEALYVTANGDVRAYNALQTTAQALFAYSYHLRHPTSLRPWTPHDEPTQELRYLTLTKAANPNHWWPTLLSYVVTGDYAFMEETQYIPCAFWLQEGNQERIQGTLGYVEHRGSEHRTQRNGWRSLAHAAYVTPDGTVRDRYSGYLTNSIYRQWEWYCNTTIDDTGNSGGGYGACANSLGLFDGGTRYNDAYSISQIAINSSMFLHITNLGFETSRCQDLLLYSGKAWVAVMGGYGAPPSTGFCYRDATFYEYQVGAADPAYYSTWQEVWEQISTRDTTCTIGQQFANSADSPGDYLHQVATGLIAAYDAGYPGAAAAWANYKASLTLSGATPETTAIGASAGGWRNVWVKQVNEWAGATYAWLPSAEWVE